ncbi:MAG: aconitate hydratase [Clostridia bacterium]|nr:aconitate hydratase [Clostridia bacterium]
MALTLAQKLLNSHIVSGTPAVGNEVALRIDQTLTQDATGTMAYLEYEAMNSGRVKTELSVAYIDHNTLQSGFENADDHRYIQSCAAKYGLYFSRPGNGICHQVHLERFGVPGKTLIGSDSHTPTGGGIGMLAFGAGGLDVAVALGGGEYRIPYPKVVGVHLTGSLPAWVGAKDIILHLLSRLTVKGGVGKIFEYFGDGVASLSVPERATVTNMGAELGATTSIFPSDENTYKFLKAQGREEAYTPLCADEGAQYDEVVEVDLSSLVPLAACPHSPDNVVPVSELSHIKVDQVCIGSCTNSSFTDISLAAAVLKGKTVHENVSLAVSPGSRQVLAMAVASGAMGDILGAGARLLESACGPCIGMGQSPCSGGVSLRTFNRNFCGRSGTADGQVYLVSPAVAAASAVTGYITDPRTLGDMPEIKMPEVFSINDNMLIPPYSPEESEKVEILRGPNIKPVPVGKPLTGAVEGECILKVEDNITTDHIMPAGAKILPYRSNIPYLSKFCFAACDEGFSALATEKGGGIIIAGANYGQGSSREHAALVPLYLGVKAVVAVSFARIHLANLINAGIVPLTFANPEDYNLVSLGDNCVIQLSDDMNSASLTVNGKTLPLVASFSDRQKALLKAGGLLPFTGGNK